MAQVTLVVGTPGQFDVVSDGRIVFSKHKEGRFPTEDEVVKALLA